MIQNKQPKNRRFGGEPFLAASVVLLVKNTKSDQCKSVYILMLVWQASSADCIESSIL